jgi:hypothetical protein
MESPAMTGGSVATMILSKEDAWAFLEASRSFSAVLNEIMLRRSQVSRSREAREARIANVRLNL